MEEDSYNEVSIMEEEEEDPPKFVAHIHIPQVMVFVALRKLDNALMADGAEALANKKVIMELLVILETRGNYYG